MRLICLSVGCRTGHAFVSYVREEFGGDEYQLINGDEIGLLDAPERTAAGSCIRVDDNPVINGMQSQVWRY